MKLNLKDWFTAVLLITLFFSFSSVAGADDSDIWIPRTPLPINVKEVVAIGAGDKIYAIGYDRSPTNFNYEYDILSDFWSKKASLPTNRSGFALAAFENQIFLFGGWVHVSTSSTATSYLTGATLVYDIASDSWETRGFMPVPRWDLKATVVQDKIYLIGGRSNSGVSAANWVYDPSADTWSKAASIPEAVSNYASAVVDNKIYVLGNGTGGKYGNAGVKVQIYTPETDAWTDGKPLPIPAGDASATVIGKQNFTRIILLGISDELFDQNSTAHTQIYNIDTKTYTIGNPIPEPSYISFSLINFNETVFAVGGRPFAGYAVPGLFPTRNQQYIPPAHQGPTEPITASPTMIDEPTPSPTIHEFPSSIFFIIVFVISILASLIIKKRFEFKNLLDIIQFLERRLDLQR